MQLSYTYDALGRRTSKTVQGGTPTQFLYDGQNAVQETVGSTINPILVGLGVDERFARNDTTGRTYFLSDAINSTIALTSAAGAIQNTYSYDPYGNTTQSNASFTNPYQYTGREADTPGLYYYRARYYSPAMGGMISEDPAQFYGGQLSFYAYVGGNPINYIDPYGLAQVIANAPIWGPIAGQLTIGDTDGQWSVGFKIGIGAGYSLELDTSDQERPCGWDWGYNVSGKIGRIDGIDAEVNHSYTTGDTESAINFNDPLDTGKSYSMSVENGDINTFQPFQAQPPTYQWGEATFIGVGGSYTFGK